MQRLTTDGDLVTAVDKMQLVTLQVDTTPEFRAASQANIISFTAPDTVLPFFEPFETNQCQPAIGTRQTFVTLGLLCLNGLPVIICLSL